MTISQCIVENVFFVFRTKSTGSMCNVHPYKQILYKYIFITDPFKSSISFLYGPFINESKVYNQLEKFTCIKPRTSAVFTWKRHTVV